MLVWPDQNHIFAIDRRDFGFVEIEHLERHMPFGRSFDKTGRVVPAEIYNREPVIKPIEQRAISFQ